MPKPNRENGVFQTRVGTIKNRSDHILWGHPIKLFNKASDPIQYFTPNYYKFRPEIDFSG